MYAIRSYYAHVSSTGNIGLVRIVAESSIAAGIRRIEAITGKAVEDLLDKQQDTLSEAKEVLNNAPDVLVAIKKLAEEAGDLRKKIEAFQHTQILALRDKLISEAKEVSGTKVISFNGNLAADQVKTLAFQIRNMLSEKLYFVAGCVVDGKPSLTVLLSDDLVATVV